MTTNRDRDPEQTAAQRAQAAKDAENLRLDQEEDIRWLMSHRRGRNIINRLFDVTGVFRSSFTGNSETFFREGGRNVGLVFLADIQLLAPEEYLHMLTEHRQVRPNNESGGRAQ